MSSTRVVDRVDAQLILRATGSCVRTLSLRRITVSMPVILDRSLHKSHFVPKKSQ
jgi:hypothetical protein